ncbi:MAG TPA: universal stress protein, partial [Terriglobales bacterium]|nr:universal stress protein [Terriglobales bacterium]
EPRLAVPIDRYPAELDTARQDATEQMEGLLSQDVLKGLPQCALVERGTIADVIPTVIQREDADLVVVGTRGHRGLKKLMLGSVAEQIFRLATCPVITIGPETVRDDVAPGEFPKILFAADFSPACVRALPWALSLAKEDRSRLTMLHVIEEISDAGLEYLEGVTQACKQRLTELLPAGAGEWCRPEFLVEVGPAADMILKVAQEEQANLIVMGARRRGAMAASHLPWATAYAVACHAVCPVLTVRE